MIKEIDIINGSRISAGFSVMAEIKSQRNKNHDANNVIKMKSTIFRSFKLLQKRVHFPDVKGYD